MKKLAAVFAIAVLGPSLVLAWLATRSLRDQEVIVHSQRALLHQGATDALAGDLNAFLGDVRAFYGRLMEELITEVGPDELASNFDAIVRSRWSQAAVGATVTDDGRWLNPPVTSTDPGVQQFIRFNQSFLQNEASSEVYVAPATIGNVVVVQEIKESDWKSSWGRAGSEAPLPKVLPAEPEEVATAPTRETSVARKELPAMASAPAMAAAPAPSAAPAAAAMPEPKMISQQKVTIDENRLSTRSASSIALNFPVPSEVPAAASAPGAGRPPGGIEDPVGVGQEGKVTNGANDIPVDALGKSQETPGRSRNVTPLGQLDQFQNDGQYDRFTLAANNALADNPNRQVLSNLDVSSRQLREIISEGPEGAISRFTSGGLQVLLWRRDPAAPGVVFWVQLSLDELKRELTEIIRETGALMGPAEVSLALLDAGGQVVAQTTEGFTTDWRQPFVATEVGEMLPHWEVAAYLIDPRAVARSARSARLTIWMLVPVLLIAIAVGSVLIIRDIGREMEFARQKTDFVSNVSHELKTPLTSIRMFSDLLSQKPGMPDGKRTEYSGIISREAARLSRLINNLLDFSRLERGEKRYQMEHIDASDLVRETVDNCRHQIESEGYTLCLDEGPCVAGTCIRGDRDALSQVLLNLLSNAEKYGGGARRIDVETRRVGDSIHLSVLDRGPGIHRRHATRIFEKFFRVDDSLSSGIEGSGLGLTLARQIARAHRGDVDYSPRPGGGSRFTLRLPLSVSEYAPLQS